MPKIRPWMLVVGIILMAGVAYVAGRCGVPGRQDAITESLLAGISAYNKQNAALLKQLAEGKKQVALGLERERALARKRTPTPALVPASCIPWATNLLTCDQQKDELRSQLEATGRLLALSEIARDQSKARDDSLAKALKKSRSGDYFLGLKLPSRTTSLGLGGLIGGGACFLLRH
jgi:hypothetical protein